MCGASSCCILARGMVIGDSPPLSLITSFLSSSASYWTWSSTSTVAQSVELLADHTASVAAQVVNQCPTPEVCPTAVCAQCGRCEACTIVKAGWPDLPLFYVGLLAGLIIATLVCALPCLVRLFTSAARVQWTSQYQIAPSRRIQPVALPQALENHDTDSSPSKVWTPKTV